jgi:hypothetical protein
LLRSTLRRFSSNPLDPPDEFRARHFEEPSWPGRPRRASGLASSGPGTIPVSWADAAPNRIPRTRSISWCRLYVQNPRLSSLP